MVFITTRPINPVNSGTKVVLYNYCKHIAESIGYKIYLYSFYENEEDLNIQQPDFIEEQHYLKQPGKLEKIYNIFKYTIIKKIPIQNSLYFRRENQDFIESEINRIKPDVLMCDLCRTAEYITNITKYNGVKILEMQDLISKRYKRQLNYNTASDSVYGAYSDKIPLFIKSIMNLMNLNKLVLKVESGLLERYEKNIEKKVDKIILVSKKESNTLNEITDSNKACAVQLGVDKSFYTANSHNDKDRKCIGFIGNMTVAHNKDTVANFIKEIFPKVIELDPDIKLKIIGKCDNDYINKYSNKNIEFTGEVEDIKVHAMRCEIIVAPLVYGSGIKTKVLESMAMGIPVITNDIGVEGINAINNQHLVISDLEDMHIEIIDLINNQEKIDYIAKEGKRFVVENFNWKNNLLTLDSLLP
ncbi:glycosyltransferase family 4 protein [Clostridium paraputrificum]|uniref:glycosyltransferase family 4 protein n=1 Tax=Clostridium paraputrificum TaxID=29363 RepID=UPI003D3416E0